jgi:hypothetical protein
VEEHLFLCGTRREPHVKREDAAGRRQGEVKFQETEARGRGYLPFADFAEFRKRFAAADADHRRVALPIPKGDVIPAAERQCMRGREEKREREIRGICVEREKEAREKQQLVLGVEVIILPTFRMTKEISK